MSAGTDRRTLVAAVAGAGLGLAALGLLDVGLLLARDAAALSEGDALRLSIAGAVAGATAGTVGGALLSPLTAALRGRRGRSLLGALAVSVGAAAAVADARVLVGLYPWFHTALGVMAALGLTVGGALLLPRRAGLFALPLLLLVAVSAWWSLGATLGGGLRLRQVVAHGTRLTAWVAPVLLDDPDPVAAATDCVWPPPASVGADGRARGRSILLITVDALRGDLGGDRLPETMPRTAAALTGAARFDRAYAAATRTAESVYALLTGRYVHRLRFDFVGVDPNDRVKILEDPGALERLKQSHPAPVRDATPTLPALLRAAGLRSVAVVPYVFFLPQAGITREFDVVDSEVYDTLNRDNRGVTSAALTARALARFDEAGDAPLFLWVHYMDPHSPYVPYGDVTADAEMKPRYLSELRRVDDALAELLRGLADRGRLDDLVVVLTADHGEEFREHGGLFHGTTVFDEQARVPLHLRVPGGAARVVDAPVSLVDLAPTLVDLAGAPTDVPFDGRSLVTLLDGAQPPPRPVLSVSTLDGLKVAVVEGTHKMIADVPRDTVSLFDLERDPAERADLVDAEPARVAHLRCLLERSGALSTQAGGAAER